jgi:hypothetical protein
MPKYIEITFDLRKIVESWRLPWDAGCADGFDPLDHVYFDGYYEEYRNHDFLSDIKYYLPKNHPAQAWDAEYIDSRFGLRDFLVRALNNAEYEAWSNAGQKAHRKMCDDLIAWLADNSDGAIEDWDIKWDEQYKDPCFDVPVVLKINIEKAGEVLSDEDPNLKFEKMTLKEKKETIEKSKDHFVTSYWLSFLYAPPRYIRDHEIKPSDVEITNDMMRYYLTEAIEDWKATYEEEKKERIKFLRIQADELEKQTI